MPTNITDIIKHYQHFIECLTSGERFDVKNLEFATLRAACDYDAAKVAQLPTEDKKSLYDAFLWLLVKSKENE